MTAWEAGLGAIARVLGTRTPGVRVERVEARSDGSLVWTVDDGPAMRWFRSSEDELEELHPAGDSAVPGAALAPRERILSWRPGRRITWDDPSARRVWKAVRPGRDARTAATFERVAADVAAADRARPVVEDAVRLVVPRIVARAPEHSAFALERLAGAAPDLSSSLDAWRAAGGALARFQDAVDPAGLVVHDANSEIAVIRDLEARYERVAGPTPDGFGAALDCLTRAVEALEPGAPVAAHRDLYDQQLLVAGRVCGILDLDLLSCADEALDAANLTAHCALRALQQGNQAASAAARDAEDGFLSGFGGRANPRFQSAFAFYRGATFVRLSLVYALRPRWRALTPSLLERARTALEGVRSR